MSLYTRIVVWGAVAIALLVAALTVVTLLGRVGL
jgi:hypothetical protein